MKTAVILLAVACFYVRNAACDVTDDDEHREWLLEEVKHDPRLYELFQSLTLRELTQIHDSPRSQARGYPFRCVVNVSDTVPTSVHKLRPSDINAIAAMGDSLSAGYGAGAATLAGVGTNYRGMAWSIGGDATLNEVGTTANIFKAFNPDLKGYSITISDRRHYKTHLNVAVGGKTSHDMPEQARELLRRIRLGVDGVDFYNDWKVITLFIGGNNLCDYCKQPEDNTADWYASHITEALDLFHRELPRALVNLVACVDITQLSRLISSRCRALHRVACPCGAFDKKSLGEVQQLQQEYNARLRTLAQSGRYDTRDDFTVVYQPFYERTAIPVDHAGRADESFMAPDCFHFSQKGQEWTGMALWDNMLQPVGKKANGYTLEDAKLDCPTADRPYLATNKNS